MTETAEERCDGVIKVVVEQGSHYALARDRGSFHVLARQLWEGIENALLWEQLSPEVRYAGRLLRVAARAT